MNVAGRKDSRREDQSSAMARGAIWLVQLYQNAISARRPASCRFVPTCSAYAVDAVREWGALRGAALALARLGRCGPWHRGGWDPVPTRDEAIRPQRTGDADRLGSPGPTAHAKPGGHPNTSGHSCHVGHTVGLLAHGSVTQSPGAAAAPAVSSRSD